MLLLRDAFECQEAAGFRFGQLGQGEHTQHLRPAGVRSPVDVGGITARQNHGHPEWGPVEKLSHEPGLHGRALFEGVDEEYGTRLVGRCCRSGRVGGCAGLEQAAFDVHDPSTRSARDPGELTE
ncbi:hypothetical protein GCM10012280_45670 [Wenjunlia tyrosinilytica]|uniref:Uncharacterized protein n=1 Tax=Wenjunlia tyrosinilytica TaxID=1544741 RepID=A0A917ZUZ5_9ACTN|nr:hypothetical protein GCM10012280_45670 [Wenjunlia tyrosinilytica]